MITIESVKLSTQVEPSIKRLLAEYPTQELRPLALMQWARRVIAEGRKLNHDDEEITSWVVLYGKQGNWSANQISAVLVENGIRRNNRYHDKEIIIDYSVHDLISGIRKIVERLSGLSYIKVLELSSRSRLTEIAEDNLREIAARMNTADRSEVSRQIKDVQPLLERMKSIVEEVSKCNSS